MNPQESPQYNQYNPETRVSNELSVTQPGEVTICTIKRHPIGILAIYVGISLMLAVAAVLAFGVVPTVMRDSGNQGAAAGAILFLLLTALAMVYALIATKIYWGNSWIVTSDSVTQISQTSLFGRQSSQLALVNIEDVTAEQNGIFSHMFNYGVLKAETAGHHSKFVFNFCPNPNYYAQQILAAREAIGSHGHHQAQYDQGPAWQQPQQSQSSFQPAPYPQQQPPAGPQQPNIPPAYPGDPGQNQNNGFNTNLPK